jgi:molybdopterin converting factor small subunit
MAEPDAAATIPVEMTSWVTRFVGGDGSGRRVVDEPWEPGATVRSMLRSVSSRFPDLAQALWQGSDLGENLEILVNDAVLGIHHELDSPLEPGDRITLLAQFMGGAS